MFTCDAQNFYWTAAAIGLGRDSTLKELRRAAEKHCARPWHLLHAEYSGHVPDRYLARNCFGATYVYVLLHHRYELGLDALSCIEHVCAYTCTQRMPWWALVRIPGNRNGRKDAWMDVCVCMCVCVCSHAG